MQHRAGRSLLAVAKQASTRVFRAYVTNGQCSSMTQALLPNFNRWLKDRGLQPATLLALRKESILNDTTLRLLTDSDLEALKKQYKISLGQFALLRSARDDLTSAVAEDFEVIELTDVPEDPSQGRRSTGGRPDSAGRGQQVCNCHMSVQ